MAILKGIKVAVRMVLLAIRCLALAGGFACIRAADTPSFEVASVKPSSPSARSIECNGGPGTTSPAIFKCSNVPLVFLISHAFGFQPFELSPRSACCQGRFDITAKVPEGSTKEQFDQMLRNLLVERFMLKLHHEQKEMTVYALTIGERGLKMTESPPGAAVPPKDPWIDHPPYTVAQDGYPVFSAGQFGLAGANGHYRWAGVNVAMPEIVKVLSYYLGGPVIDETKCEGKFDINLTWTVDLAGLRDSNGNQIPEGSAPYGPTIIKAVHDQLGLQLKPRKGRGDVVVIDYVAKSPTSN